MRRCLADPALVTVKEAPDILIGPPDIDETQATALLDLQLRTAALDWRQWIHYELTGVELQIVRLAVDGAEPTWRTSSPTRGRTITRASAHRMLRPARFT